MLKRYHITLGATTSAGGTVTSASSLMSVGGARIALEGDEVSCAACGNRGIIKLDGPRLSERFNDRQVALSGDLCACRCDPPPKLVNSQTHKYQSIDIQSIDIQASAAIDTLAIAAHKKAAQASASAAEADGKASIRLLEPGTRQPFRQRPYRLQLADKVLEGTTDEEGFTQPLSASERASLVAWHVAE